MKRILFFLLGILCITACCITKPKQNVRVPAIADTIQFTPDSDSLIEVIEQIDVIDVIDFDSVAEAAAESLLILEEIRVQGSLKRIEFINDYVRFRQVTKTVNGGYNGWQDRYDIWLRAREIFED